MGDVLRRNEIIRRPVSAAVVKAVPLNLRLIQTLLLGLTAYTLYLGALTLYAGLGYGLSSDLRDRLYVNASTATEREVLKRWRTDVLSVWDAWLPYDDLAQIVMADALEKGMNSQAGRKMMPEVLRLEAEALQRNPANSYAWARLAYARYVYNGASRLVVEPLVQSIQSAPYEPSLLAARIVLALKTEKYWTAEMIALFPQQLERAWLRESVDTVRAAYQDGIESTLREKLADDLVKRAQFDKLLADMRPK